MSHGIFVAIPLFLSLSLAVGFVGGAAAVSRRTATFWLYALASGIVAAGCGLSASWQTFSTASAAFLFVTNGALTIAGVAGMLIGVRSALVVEQPRQGYALGWRPLRVLPYVLISAGCLASAVAAVAAQDQLIPIHGVRQSAVLVAQALFFIALFEVVVRTSLIWRAHRVDVRSWSALRVLLLGILAALAAGGVVISTLLLTLMALLVLPDMTADVVAFGAVSIVLAGDYTLVRRGNLARK